ncbi:zymogen granule membrane protein 16-like [Vanacampus margaritifer]
MFLLVFSVLLSTIFADELPGAQYYSYSKQIGAGSGGSYVINGNGRITGVRIWEAYNNFIFGLQLRYDYTWTNVMGTRRGQMQQILLFDDETIVQISGKYAHFIQSLVFTTNLGRSLHAGKPRGHSFNMYANTKKAELRFISGRAHGAITSIGAHWAVVSETYLEKGK